LDQQGILLVSHGHFDGDLIDKVTYDVKIEFQMQVQLIENHMDLTAYYDPKRRQYDGNQLLKMLNGMRGSEYFRTMGLFRVDLFIPILTFIFGQAIFKGYTGIASSYRLRNEQYGMPKDDFLLYDRFRKVVIHELGHTFGLVHCFVPSCVMRSSTYVEDIDQKKHHFCSRCRSEMTTFLNNSIEHQ
jgi:archaemetzincin